MNDGIRRGRTLTIAVILMLALAALLPIRQAGAQGASRTFPETGKTVQGTFLTYWNTHGGLVVQGLPISDELQEKSELDGQTYTVQYFERALFELHPDNPPPNDVLLAQLGRFKYDKRYPNGAPGQQANTDNPRQFSETGQTLGGNFRQFWETHGGLAQLGYPISNEFQEKSDVDGKTYGVQYFERVEMEHHPEFAGTPYEVLLTPLGTWYRQQRQGTPSSPGNTQAAATSIPAQGTNAASDATSTAVAAAGTANAGATGTASAAGGAAVALVATETATTASAAGDVSGAATGTAGATGGVLAVQSATETATATGAGTGAVASTTTSSTEGFPWLWACLLFGLLLLLLLLAFWFRRRREPEGYLDTGATGGRPATPGVAGPNVGARTISPAPVDTPKADRSLGSLPKLETPKADLPGVALPGVALPGVDAPKVDLGNIQAPKLEAPDLSASQVDLPKVEKPSLPPPEIETPAVSLSHVDLPTAELPTIEAPAVDLPASPAPQVNLSGIDLPKVEAPTMATGDIAAPSVAAPQVNVAAASLPTIDIPVIETPAANPPDTAVPDVPLPAATTPDMKLGGLQAPTIDISGSSTPNVDRPKIDVPSAALPDVKVPDIALPKVEAPDVALGDLQAPTIEPETFGANVPAVSLPKADLPTIETPAVELPTIEAPTVDLPAAPVSDMAMPRVDAPHVDLGDIQAPTIEAPGASGPAIAASGASEFAVDLPAGDTPAVDMPHGGAPTVDLSQVAALPTDMPGAAPSGMDMPGPEVPDVEPGTIPGLPVEAAGLSLPAASRGTADLPVETLRAEMPGVSLPGGGLEGDSKTGSSIRDADVAGRRVPDLEAPGAAMDSGRVGAAQEVTAAPGPPTAVPASASTDTTSTAAIAGAAGAAGMGAARAAGAAGATSQPAPPGPSAESTPAPGTPKGKTPVLTTATGAVAISHIEYKGEEYAEITNSGLTPANLGGWVLRDQHDPNQLYRFAADVRLAPNERLRVYAAPGHQHSFNSKRPIMNDRGDAFELLNRDGQVISTYAYGIYATEGAGRAPAIDVVIAEVQYAGEEYVLITNKGTGLADLDGWTLRDQNDADQAYTFPAGTTLANGAVIRIYTAPGHPYSFNSHRPIWNNAGDALELLDAGGKVISTYAYGSYAK